MHVYDYLGAGLRQKNSFRTYTARKISVRKSYIKQPASVKSHEVVYCQNY
jgi:hypothetical protein